MSKPTHTALFVLLAALGASAAAMAQSGAPAGSSAATTAQATSQPQGGSGTGQADSQRSPRPGDRDCIQSTGSLIPAKPGSCLPVPGRSYSRDDLLKTGQPNLGPALRDLDPSISYGGR
ncbi:hypothetical protein [Dyella sp. C9]|uniref:hypothetical protein n=1 Tax=Dyella sp. C9 TaxID=2202154 RepID=UPI000DEF9500|nr:hypothetical protein [Dyella sp. C9]